MSDMEKAIDQKLAEARKRSGKEDAKCNDKKPVPKKPSNSESKNNTNAKTVNANEKNKDARPKDGDKPSNSSKQGSKDGTGNAKKDDKSVMGKDQVKNKNPGSSKQSDKTSGKNSISEKKPTVSSKTKSDDSKVNKESGKTSTTDRKPETSTKNKSEDGKAKAKPKHTDEKQKDGKESQDTSKPKTDEKQKESKDSRDTAKSRTSREKSRSPAPFVRNYNFKRTFGERYTYRGGRSPVRRRSRSRSPLHKRSRSPVRRRSPSLLGRRDTWRRSPRRRSRSPRNRSPARPYRGRSRSRSSERRDPKALIAKKSFLDDLAVKFAQEGKEFPELEQYRCEINSQFVSYPIASQFSKHAVEHVCVDVPDRNPFMDMDMDMEMMPPMNVPMGNPIVMTDPYNAYPMYPEAQPLISYPIQDVQPALNSPGMSFDSPRPPSVSSFQKESISVAKPTNEQQNTGIHPPQQTEIWTKQEVKIRIKQALQLLDNADKSIIKSGKFMFRAPTFYENDVNENRSPIVQSANNPLFAMSNSSGLFSDPFGNVPRKVKAVVDVLRMDEGLISQRIFQRQQKKQEATSNERSKLEAEERIRRIQGTSSTKVQLQKTTQTDPTVCTDCLLRKIKVRYNEETQTEIVRTVDSGAQTNPITVQTVSEFGSITELTPNQVRAVSELIKYIKLTVTSGSLQEMRDSLKEDQVYNLNSDLRMAYNYFDTMVEQQNLGGAQKDIPDEGDTFEQPDDDYIEPDKFIENENVDEYEEYHRAFCPDVDEEDGGQAEVYSNPLLQRQPISVKRTMDNRNTFVPTGGYKNSFGNTGGNYGAPSQGQYRRGGGRGAKQSFQPVSYNRRN